MQSSVGTSASFRDLRRWINQECGIYSSSNGDSDNANEYIKRREQANLHHHHQQQQQQQQHLQQQQQQNYPQQRRRTGTSGATAAATTRQPTILQKLFGVDHQASPFSNDSHVASNVTRCLSLFQITIRH